MDNQSNLIDFYVDRLLKKHDVTSKKSDLSDDERARLKGIIENIENDVKSFLEAAEKKTTEHDMEVKLTPDTTETTSISANTPETPKTKPKMFLSRQKKNNN